MPIAPDRAAGEGTAARPGRATHVRSTQESEQQLREAVADLPQTCLVRTCHLTGQVMLAADLSHSVKLATAVICS